MQWDALHQGKEKEEQRVEQAGGLGHRIVKDASLRAARLAFYPNTTRVF